MPQDSTCQHCNKVFSFYPSQKRKYCSHHCSCQAKRLYEDRQCPICKKVFAPRKTRGGGKLRQFCSVKCRAAATKKPKLERTCPHCQEKFYILKSKTGRGRGKYCSKKCAISAQKKPESYMRCKCQNCDREFSTLISQINHRGGGKFCSNKCRVEYCIGKNHPRWKENKADPERGNNWYIQRRKALRRDNHRCRICNRSRASGYPIDVHHIIPYCQFNHNYEKANSLNNLIALCRPHHRKVEAGKILCPSP